MAGFTGYTPSQLNAVVIHPLPKQIYIEDPESNFYLPTLGNLLRYAYNFETDPEDTVAQRVIDARTYVKTLYGDRWLSVPNFSDLPYFSTGMSSGTTILPRWNTSACTPETVSNFVYCTLRRLSDGKDTYAFGSVYANTVLSQYDYPRNSKFVVAEDCGGTIYRKLSEESEVEGLPDNFAKFDEPVRFYTLLDDESGVTFDMNSDQLFYWSSEMIDIATAPDFPPNLLSDSEMDKGFCTFGTGYNPLSVGYSLEAEVGKSSYIYFGSAGSPVDFLQSYNLPSNSDQLVEKALLFSTIPEGAELLLHRSGETYVATASSNNWPMGGYLEQHTYDVYEFRLQVGSSLETASMFYYIATDFTKLTSYCSNTPPTVECHYPKMYGSFLDNLLSGQVFDGGALSNPNTAIRQSVYIISPQKLAKAIRQIVEPYTEESVKAQLEELLEVDLDGVYVLLGAQNTTMTPDRSRYSPFAIDNGISFNVSTWFRVHCLTEDVNSLFVDNPFFPEVLVNFSGSCGGAAFELPLYAPYMTLPTQDYALEGYSSLNLETGFEEDINGKVPNNMSIQGEFDYFLLTCNLPGAGFSLVSGGQDYGLYKECNELIRLLQDFIVPWLQNGDNWVPPTKIWDYDVEPVDSHIIEVKLGHQDTRWENQALSTVGILIKNSQGYDTYKNILGLEEIPLGKSVHSFGGQALGLYVLPEIEEPFKYIIRKNGYSLPPSCGTNIETRIVISNLFAETPYAHILRGEGSVIGSLGSNRYIRYAENYLVSGIPNTDFSEASLVMHPDSITSFGSDRANFLNTHFYFPDFESWLRIDMINNDFIPPPPETGVCVYEENSTAVKLNYALTAGYNGSINQSMGVYCGVRHNFPGYRVPYPTEFSILDIYGVSPNTLVILKYEGEFYSLVNDGSHLGYPLWDGNTTLQMDFGDYIHVQPMNSSVVYTDNVVIGWGFDTVNWPNICEIPETPDDTWQDSYNPSRPVRPINPLDPRQRVKPAGVLDPNVDLNAIERFRPLDPWESYLRNYRKGVKSSDAENDPTKPLDWNKP